MDWMMIGTVLAGAAAVATAIITVANQLSAPARYDLWVRVLNNARNDHQKEIAADRVDYYFVELAVVELTRRRRAQLLVVGFSSAAIGFVVIAAGVALTEAGDVFALGVGWVVLVIGTVGYIGGLAVASIGPDRVRDTQRAQTTQASAAAALREIRPLRWWQRRRATA